MGVIAGRLFIRSIADEILAGAFRPIATTLLIPTVSYALLSQLFRTQADSATQGVIIAELAKKQYSPAEVLFLGRALHVRAALETYRDRFGKLPDNLYALGLDTSVTNDIYGRSMSYLSSGDLVLLGTPGENGQWDISMQEQSMILRTESEYVFKFGDSFFVKFRIAKHLMSLSSNSRPVADGNLVYTL